VALVLDTGVVIALLDGDEPHHARCALLTRDVTEDLVLPAPTLAEIDYWFRKRGRVATWMRFVEEIVAGGFRLHRPDDEEVERAARLELQYEDLGLGFVDASVVVTCETLGETKLATLDRRHFSVVRPRHCEALTLLPE
jgi:predicted nucleic acid-binding protein